MASTLTAAWGLNKAQLICYISRFVTVVQTIPHISSVGPGTGVYILPLSSTSQLALSSSVSQVFFLSLEYPFCFQAENQIYKSKAMGESGEE